MPSTNNVLHTYLKSVNSNSDSKKKNIASRRTKKFEKDQNDERAIDREFTKAVIYSDFQQAYNGVKATIHKINSSLRTTLITLLQKSHGKAVHYELAVNLLSETLGLNKIEVKQQLLQLVELKLVVMFEHQWKGHMLNVNTIAVPHIINDDAISINNVHLAHYSLVSPSTILPLEKQFLLYMFEISHCSLLLNDNKELYKSKVDELRLKFLKINPMLLNLDVSIFTMTPMKEKVESFCEDAIVNFILQIAYKSNFLVIQHNKLMLHNVNWAAWLSYPTYMQQQLLKCIVDDTIKQMTSEYDYYKFIQLLYTQDNWTLFAETSNENINIVKLGQATGWLDIINNDKVIYIRHKLLISHNSRPCLLPNLQIYCFEDCYFGAIWELQQFAKIEQWSEVVKFQVDVNSLERAFDNGISSKQIEATLGFEKESESYVQFQRLVSLINKNKQVNMLVKREIDNIVMGTFEQSFIITHYTYVQIDQYLHFLKANIKNDENKLAMYPAIWFSSLRNYNQTVLAEMVTVAVNYGFKLEMNIEHEQLTCLPTQIEVNNNEAKVYGFQIVGIYEKLDKIFQSWLLSSVTKLRLCR